MNIISVYILCILLCIIGLKPSYSLPLVQETSHTNTIRPSYQQRQNQQENKNARVLQQLNKMWNIDTTTSQPPFIFNEDTAGNIALYYFNNTTHKFQRLAYIKQDAYLKFYFEYPELFKGKLYILDDFTTPAIRYNGSAKFLTVEKGKVRSNRSIDLSSHHWGNMLRLSRILFQNKEDHFNFLPKYLDRNECFVLTYNNINYKLVLNDTREHATLTIDNRTLILHPKNVIGLNVYGVDNNSSAIYKLELGSSKLQAIPVASLPEGRRTIMEDFDRNPYETPHPEDKYLYPETPKPNAVTKFVADTGSSIWNGITTFLTWCWKGPATIPCALTDGLSFIFSKLMRIGGYRIKPTTLCVDLWKE